MHTFARSVNEISKENIPREWSSGLNVQAISQAFDWIVYEAVWVQRQGKTAGSLYTIIFTH